MRSLDRIRELITTRMGSCNIRLADKGVLLVALPIVFQVVFVLILSLLLRNAEFEIEKESHYRDVAAETSLLGQVCYEGLLQLALYGAIQDAERARGVDKAASKIENQINYLRAMVVGNQDSSAELRSLDSLARVMVTNFASAKHTVDSGSKLESALVLGRINSDLGDFLNASSQFIQSQREHGATSSNAQSRELIRFAIILGVLANAGLATGIGIIFAKDITKRLGVVVQNSKLLADGKPLMPQLTGSDEIAVVDNSFHVMAQELAEHADREQEMLAVVSHDIRTPLASAHVLLSSLSQRGDDEMSTATREQLRKAEQIVSHLVQFTNDLLDAQKIRAGRMELVKVDTELDAICAISIEMLAPIAEAKGVTVELAAPEIVIEADPDRLQQITTNLITNAIKASPPNSKVLVSVRADDKVARVSVRDFGAGVPSDVQASIFDRYTQLPDRQTTMRGTGLGLPICKMIVELHGGTIGVDSQPGSGSVFWFEIPLTTVLRST